MRLQRASIPYYFNKDLLGNFSDIQDFELKIAESVSLVGNCVTSCDSHVYIYPGIEVTNQMITLLTLIKYSGALLYGHSLTMDFFVCTDDKHIFYRLIRTMDTFLSAECPGEYSSNVFITLHKLSNIQTVYPHKLKMSIKSNVTHCFKVDIR